MTARPQYWAVLALLSACAGTSDQVVTVARADLACQQVEIAEVSRNRFAASGCGKAATYTELCTEYGCSWARVRTDAEQMTSGGAAPPPPTNEAPPREIIPAPAPQQREVIPAPPPATATPRQVIPAPPPASTSGDQAPGAQPAPSGTAPAGANAPADNSQQPFTPQPTPLSQGELSEPYEAEVPAQPVAQRVEYAPPAPLVEQPPPPPASNYVWVSGYWWWGNPRWTWVSGYWCPPYYGYRYVPGSWYWANNYWYYGPGGWARPGATLIVRHLPPRPRRVIHVRSFTPHAGYHRGYAHGSYGRGGQPPARMGVTSARVPAPRAFTPQASPLHRYPSSLSRPSSNAARLGSGPPRMGSGRVSSPSISRQPQPFSGRSGPGGNTAGRIVQPRTSVTRMPSTSAQPAAPSSFRAAGRFGGGSSGAIRSAPRGGGGGFRQGLSPAPSRGPSPGGGGRAAGRPR